MATPAEGVHELAPHHIPVYVPGVDGSDPMMFWTGVFLLVVILLLGIGYLTLHALPEHMASETNRAQFQLVSILAILALFTHNNLFWVAALLLAVVQIPDLVSPVKSMARSLARISRRIPETTSPATARAASARTDGEAEA